jgi:NAD-dependent SIR2 family protein deacetylase
MLVQSLARLVEFLPFQVELGCGISSEAGIPPLHFLHELYTVTNRDAGTFIFGGSADTFFPQFLSKPEFNAHRQARMMCACLMAEPMQTHQILKELAARRILLTPIIRNNFDGLPARVGLDEYYIRRYDQDAIEVPIHPETRALLVIGSHADRRKVQACFRERRLPICFQCGKEFIV